MTHVHRNPSRLARRAGARCALGLALLAPSAGAQAADLASAASCLDAIPASAYARTAVFLTVTPTPSDSSANALLPAADLLASLAATRVRLMLGADGEMLPVGEPAYGWRDMGPGLDVTLHRDGRFAWREHESGELAPDAAGRAATDSLAAALERLRADGERLFWPDGAPGDSAVFHLGFDWPIVHPDGTAEPRTARMVAPAFTVAAPWRSPVEPVEPPRIRFPASAQTEGVEGGVVMRYVVDSTGRVDMGSVEDVWPAGRPRQRGRMGRHYATLVEAVTRGLRDATFRPAQVGGCRVRMLVQQPFVFGLR